MKLYINEVVEIAGNSSYVRVDELHLKQAIGGESRPVDFGTNDYSVLKKLGQHTP